MRKVAIPINNGPWQETLYIQTSDPARLSVKKSHLVTATDSTLWRKDSETRYQLFNAYSSREHAIIEKETP
ncbi:MAG: hypothetical protein FWG50_12745 [Kiritimatiellaeota bacterium]|nr:hypothetical protein [Kiritimatiellota bacterium]